MARKASEAKIANPEIISYFLIIGICFQIIFIAILIFVQNFFKMTSEPIMCSNQGILNQFEFSAANYLDMYNSRHDILKCASNVKLKVYLSKNVNCSWVGGQKGQKHFQRSLRMTL